jgi:hypothetical protein
MRGYRKDAPHHGDEYKLEAAGIKGLQLGDSYVLEGVLHPEQ